MVTLRVANKCLHAHANPVTQTDNYESLMARTKEERITQVVGVIVLLSLAFYVHSSLRRILPFPQASTHAEWNQFLTSMSNQVAKSENIRIRLCEVAFQRPTRTVLLSATLQSDDASTARRAIKELSLIHI